MAIAPKQPLKKAPDKRQMKRQLQADVDAFLAAGGSVTEVPKGQSGVAPDGFNRHPVCFTGSAESRTPVPDVVANIEKRKQAKKQIAVPASKNRQGRKKWIYDDFGEPLRWVWVD